MKEALHRWFTELRAISQYGLTYTKDVFDRERFTQVQKIASDIGSHITDHDAAELGEKLSLEVGPPSPKLDVRAAIFRESKVLMVREAADGLWSLPGGWIDVGDSPAQSAVREVKEETGIDCAVSKLIAVFDRRRHPHPPMLLHVYKLLFLCDVVGGSLTTSIETTDVGFFDLADLPPLSTGRILKEQIDLAFRHHTDRALPTAFD